MGSYVVNGVWYGSLGRHMFWIGVETMSVLAEFILIAEHSGCMVIFCIGI